MDLCLYVGGEKDSGGDLNRESRSEFLECTDNVPVLFLRRSWLRFGSPFTRQIFSILCTK